MKTALLILSFLVTVPATLAEDEKATQEVTISAEKETAEAAAERQKKLQAEERAKAMLEKAGFKNVINKGPWQNAV